MLELTINNQKYQFRFGMKLVFDLGKKWGLQSFTDVINKVNNEFLLNINENLPIDAIGIMIDMFEVQGFEDEVDFLLQYFFENPDHLKDYIQAYAASMPKGKDDVIPESNNANAKKKVQRTK